MKQFAYILLGPVYQPDKDQAEFTAGNTRHLIRTASSFEEAKALVLQLIKSGVGAIELCGAFGQQRARELMELTDCQVSISYAIHEPEVEKANQAFFA